MRQMGVMGLFTRPSGSGRSGLRSRVFGVAGVGTLLGAMVVLGPAGSAEAISQPPAGAIIVSNHSGSDVATGCATPAYTSIQSAINAAASGSTIYVCDGTYNESPSISKPLVLLGAEWGLDARTRSSVPETVIDGSGGITYGAGASSGTVNGFTLNGYTGSIGEIDAANVGSAWTWTDNIVDVSNGGIYFNTDGVVSPAATTISDNLFVQTTDAPETGSGDAGQAVLIWQKAGDNVSVTANAFTDLSGPGAAINTTAGGAGGACPQQSAGLSVTGNTFIDNGASGSGDNFLALFCTTGANVSGNTATITLASDATAESPIYLGGGDSSPTVSGNTLSGDGAPTASGIKLTTGFYPGDNATISTNTVSGFGQDGIRVYAGGSNPAPAGFTISGNTVSSSGVGIGVEAGSGGSVTNNDAVTSTTDDCLDSTTGTGTAGTADTWTGDVGGTSAPIGLCTPATPGVTTAPTKASIALGQSNTDSVAVTGNATAGNPAGGVTFYVCGPGSSATPCTSQATEVGAAAVTLAPSSGDVSTATSVAFTPTAMGTWCFAGYYSGDSNYAPGTDISTDECFTVTQAIAGVATHPVQAAIGLGQSNTDQVTVTGSAAGGVPTGTVTFDVCGPTANPAPCTSTTTPVGTFPVTLAPGTGNTATATSVSFTPTGAGTWCFAGYYSGDSNYAVGADTTTDECFTVSTAATGVVTVPTLSTIPLGQSNTDVATVTGTVSGGAPTGTVSFDVCGPALSAAPCTSTAISVGASPVALTPGTGDTAQAPSVAFTPTAPGIWCFAGHYSGDSNYAAAADTSTDECFTVTRASPNVSTTPVSSVIPAGNSDSDKVTVTGNTIGSSPTGKVTFFVCGPSASPTGCTSQANQLGGPVTLTAKARNTATAASVSFTPTSAGTWCFAAYYSGDTNYAPGSDTSISECVAVNLITSIVVSKPHSANVLPGQPNSDKVQILGSKPGPGPAGTVTFQVCGPTVTPTPCTSPISGWQDVVSVTTKHKKGSATSAGFGPTSPGYWCFAATYSGSSFYAPGFDDTSDGCFSAKGDTSVLATAPSATSITLGQSNTDTLTVTGNAKQGSPTGTATFYVCGPTIAAASCTSQTTVVGSPVTITPRPKHLSTSISAAFTPGVAGTWCFGMAYSGDSHYAAATDTDTTECFVVNPITPGVTTTPSNATITLGQSNNDSVTVTGTAAGGTPSGTVTFYVCGPTVVPAACTSQTTKVGSPSSLTSGASDTSSSTSASFTPNATGYWCFAGYYSGNANYVATADTTTDECFDVTS